MKRIQKILLETNSYSNFFRGDKKITKVITESNEVLLSVITIGELLLGFREGSRESENISVLKEFLSEPKVKVLNVNVKTSQEYVKVKYQLRRRGTLIPENDIWIAAQSIETDSVLVTYDRHFLDIPGLRLWHKFKTSFRIPPLSGG